MADALPPEPAKVQIETLKAFTADLELAVRIEAKGYGLKPVEVKELRAWIDTALASNTDEAVRPKEGWSQAPHMLSLHKNAVLGKVLEKVKARITELEAGGVEPKENTKDWLLAQLVVSSEGKVTVPGGPKAGSVRVASLEEVKGWLAAPAPKSKSKMKD